MATGTGPIEIMGGNLVDKLKKKTAEARVLLERNAGIAARKARNAIDDVVEKRLVSAVDQAADPLYSERAEELMRRYRPLAAAKEAFDRRTGAASLAKSAPSPPDDYSRPRRISAQVHPDIGDREEVPVVDEGDGEPDGEQFE